MASKASTREGMSYQERREVEISVLFSSLLLTTGSEKLSFSDEIVGPFLKVRLHKRQKFSFPGSVRPRWLLLHAN